MIAFYFRIWSMFWLPILLFLLVFLFIFLISLWKIFEKAHIEGYKAFIPFYNLYLLLQMTKIPIFFLAILFIPVIGIIAFCYISSRLAYIFDKDKNFQLGLILLPMIFYPILAFSKKTYLPKDKLKIQYEQTMDTDIVVEEIVKPEILPDIIEEQEPSKMEDLEILDIFEEEQEPVETLEEEITEPVVEDIQVETYDIPLVSNWTDEKKSDEEKRKKVILVEDPLDPLYVPPITDSKSVDLEQYKVCPNCGTKLSDQTKVCFLCGHQFEA